MHSLLNKCQRSITNIFSNKCQAGLKNILFRTNALVSSSILFQTNETAASQAFFSKPYQKHITRNLFQKNVSEDLKVFISKKMPESYYKHF